jgi:hypothetical protein
MSGYSKAVLWIGLFMIIAGVAQNWSSISGTIFGKTTTKQVQINAKTPANIRSQAFTQAGVVPGAHG